MSLEITPATGPLPTTLPDLLPFHIEYTGPAPVSRYFRPKPSPEMAQTLMATPSSGSIMTLTDQILVLDTSESQVSVATSVTAVDALSMNAVDITPVGSVKMDANLHDTQRIQDAQSRRTLSSESRLIAAFRGREIIGQAIHLPEGYRGLVLQAPSLRNGIGREVGNPGSIKYRTSTKHGNIRHTTRKSTLPCKLSENVALENDVELADEDPQRLYSPEGVRQLSPALIFPSLRIWSPDIPVDEGRDEYICTLSEWTRLAAEIHAYR